MRRARLLIAAGVGLLLCLGIPARAELVQEGSLIVSLDGRITPNRLPRSAPAPVEVTVGGTIRATKGSPLPQLQTITIGLSRAGRLEDRGVPTCRVESIQPATEGEAYRVCPRAIVGSGHLTIKSRIENQRQFTVRGSMLAFNGPRRNGRKTILAQVYSQDPPSAFVLVFTLSRRPGKFGTVLKTTLPESVREWAYLTGFELTLGRYYRTHGQVRSYISAACGAPAGFPGAIFPFARATYGFDNGQTLKATAVRSCRVED